MIQLFVDQPLILLFVVSAIGHVIGHIKIKGSSLGVAAVLFVGLAFGALDPRIKLPEIIFELGLIMFVYTVGLASGPGFFASFNRKGLRDNLFILGMIGVAAVLAGVAHFVMQFKTAVTAGLFAGSLTNTPALAGLLDTLNKTVPADQLDALLAEPVVGYSVAYPMGVLGMLFAIIVMRRIWGVDFKAEAHQLRKAYIVEQELYNRTAQVTNTAVDGLTLHELRHKYTWDVVFGRLQHRDGHVELATGDTHLYAGDLLGIIGAQDDVDAAIRDLGHMVDEHLEFDRHEYDFRRVFVSNPQIVGRSLAELKLPQTHGAIVTRVRRGDIDLLANRDTVLEYGDRVRIVTRRKDMTELSKLFGDSYKALSEVNLLSFGIGLAVGLLVGLIPIPLPGDVTFQLGAAGGPLIVGLILGAMRRSGPIVWTISYSANLTLRQIGLILLLAGIGIRSGYTFVTTFTQSGGLSIFVTGAIITSVTAFLTLLIGYKLLKLPFSILIGMLAGLQTQPAVLGFATEQSENDLPNIGYALVFPIATISKILFAQLLLMFL